jgi:hypothetical protein
MAIETPVPGECERILDTASWFSVLCCHRGVWRVLGDPADRRHPTDANGAFDSGTDAGAWTGVYLACRDIPETAHVTASDGTHQASTDISFTTCP